MLRKRLTFVCALLVQACSNAGTDPHAGALQADGGVTCVEVSPWCGPDCPAARDDAVRRICTWSDSWWEYGNDCGGSTVTSDVNETGERYFFDAQGTLVDFDTWSDVLGEVSVVGAASADAAPPSGPCTSRRICHITTALGKQSCFGNAFDADGGI
jgi:hypothetical protein